MSSGELDVESLKRQYRVTLNSRLRRRPITPETYREGFFLNSNRRRTASYDGPRAYSSE
jgi:hypothetical protein